MSIHVISDQLYFGKLQDRTHGETTSWGFLLNEAEAELSLGDEAFLSAPVLKQDGYEHLKFCLQENIKRFLNKYDRMNEVFNLQISQDNRNRVIGSNPRRSRVFLARTSSPKLDEVYMKISPVDKELTRVEGLLSGKHDIFFDSDLYMISNKTLDPLVCYYTSTVLSSLDRLRLLQEDSRREYEVA